MLEGKKTILFPIAKTDFDLFAKLHKEDNNHYMGRFCLDKLNEEEAKQYLLSLFFGRQMVVWVVHTKEGKASKKAGFIYLSDLTDSSASINGIMDPKFAEGLLKRLKKQGSYTYTEDAFLTIIKFCFEDLGFERIEADMLGKNRLASKLMEKMNFKREAKLRHAIKLDDKFEDILIYAMLKGEFKNGKVQPSKN